MQILVATVLILLGAFLCINRTDDPEAPNVYLIGFIIGFLTSAVALHT